MRRPLTTLFAVALAAIASSAGAADVIYKVRLKDGSIAFTDNVPAGAVVLDKREGPPPPALLPARPKESRTATDQRLQERARTQSRADAELAAAEEALAKARADLEKGIEPQAGERIGTVTRNKKGQTVPAGTRATDAYDERIESLKKAVAEAEARVEKARSAAR